MNSILARQSWRDLQGLPCVSYRSLEPDGARSSPVRETLGSKAAHAKATELGRKPRSWYQSPTDCLKAGMVISLSKQGSTGPHYTQTGRKKITVKPEDLTQHLLAQSRECFVVQSTRYFVPAVCGCLCPPNKNYKKVYGEWQATRPHPQ